MNILIKEGRVLDPASKTDKVIGNKNITIDTDLGNVTIHFEGE